LLDEINFIFDSTAHALFLIVAAAEDMIYLALLDARDLVPREAFVLVIE